MATTLEKILAGALIIVIIAAVIALSIVRQISNTGTISAVGFDIYSDPACTMNLTAIDWGNRHPGDVVAYLMYARNSGNVNITLSHNITDWVPVNAPNYLTITWNYTGYILRPSNVSTIMWTLAVAPNITGISTFSFKINCNATEVVS